MGTFCLQAVRLCLLKQPTCYSSAVSRRVFNVVVLLDMNEAEIFFRVTRDYETHYFAPPPRLVLARESNCVPSRL